MIGPLDRPLAAPLVWALLGLASGSFLACAGPHATGREPLELRVLSFNLWHGGEGGGQPLEASAAVIRASGADLVGLQETHGYADGSGARPDRGAELARLLGFHHMDQGGRTAILSRFPLVGPTEGGRGARIAPWEHGEIAVFNVHLAAAPYQPYQLLGIEYHGGRFLESEAEAIEAASEARGAALAEVLADAKATLSAGIPVVLTGDFNEPSHLDWTARAEAAGVVPLAVSFPAIRAVREVPLYDSYRAAHPQEVARPGWTWTPTTAEDDPKDRHDRIDFVYASAHFQVLGAKILGESGPRSDLVVTPYPSDHRAVLAHLALPAHGPALATMGPMDREGERHPRGASARWDAGDMGCGELIVLLRARMRALAAGERLHLTANDPGAREDLPAWCAMTGHRLVWAEHPEYGIERRPDAP